MLEQQPGKSDFLIPRVDPIPTEDDIAEERLTVEQALESVQGKFAQKTKRYFDFFHLMAGFMRDDPEKYHVKKAGLFSKSHKGYWPDDRDPRFMVEHYVTFNKDQVESAEIVFRNDNSNEKPPSLILAFNGTNSVNALSFNWFEEYPFPFTAEEPNKDESEWNNPVTQFISSYIYWIPMPNQEYYPGLGLSPYGAVAITPYENPVINLMFTTEDKKTPELQYGYKVIPFSKDMLRREFKTDKDRELHAKWRMKKPPEMPISTPITLTEALIQHIPTEIF